MMQLLDHITFETRLSLIYKIVNDLREAKVLFHCWTTTQDDQDQQLLMT